MDPLDDAVTVGVVDDAQRKGLGRLLATTLADAARERGVHTFRADVLADNAPMVAIMREIGAVERSSSAGVVTYDVPLDFAPDDLRNGAKASGVALPPETPSEASGSSIGASLRRLGLKLEPRKMSVDIVVIDRLEKSPTGN